MEPQPVIPFLGKPFRKGLQLRWATAPGVSSITGISVQLTVEELICAAVLLRQHADDCREQGASRLAAEHYALAAKFYHEAGVLELAAECSGLATLCQ